MIDFNKRSKAAYNRKADDYDVSREGRFTRSVQQLLLSEIVWTENQNILDVACGTGTLLKTMNDRKAIHGHGIDLSDQMVKHAAVKNPNMVFMASGCENIPFPDNSMDIITVCAAYHHFPDPPAFAKEAGRVLRQNGIIYIADMYLPSFIRIAVNPFVPLLFKDGDVKFYAPKEIVRIFEKHGFMGNRVKVSGTTQVVSMQKYQR